MLIVTGTQRSGTTFLSECFINGGFDLGSTLYDADISGGYESEFFLKWSSKYIKNFPFKDANYDTKSKLKSVNKISFLMCLPSLLSIFIEENKINAKWLVLKRNFNDVYDSKRSKKRFLLDHILLNQNPQELEMNFQKSIELLNYYEQKFIIIPFDTLKESGHKILDFTGIDISKQIKLKYNPNQINVWKQ